jgi:hypothetical protein
MTDGAGAPYQATPAPVPVENQRGWNARHEGVFLALRFIIEVLTICGAAGEIFIMPRGVPYRVQVVGRGSRTFTFTEIAAGTGLSLSAISLILRRKRPISEYAQTRLAEFFRITGGESWVINVDTPPARPLGRVVYRIHPNTVHRYGRPVVTKVYAPSQSDRTGESAPFPPRTFGDFDE